MKAFIRNNYQRIVRAIPGVLWFVKIPLLNFVLGTNGKNNRVSVEHTIFRPNKLHLGSDVFVNSGFYCSSIRDVHIQDRVMFGSNCSIIAGDHNFADPTENMRFPKSLGNDNEIWIEPDAWIGHGATILKNAHISEGSIVGAGSIINSKLKPYSIYAGAPAKFIRPRFESLDALEAYLKMMKERFGFESNYSINDLHEIYSAKLK